MKASAAKEKGAQRSASRLAHRASGPSRSYLQTRVRASRLLNAASILAIAELTRRLHQAYAQAYDEPAADKVLPQDTQPVTFLTAELLSSDKDPQTLRKASFEPTGFRYDEATLNVETSTGPAALSGDVFTVRVSFQFPEYTKIFATGTADFGSKVILGKDNRYRFPTEKEAPFGSSYAFHDDGNRRGHVDISLKVRDIEATRNKILITVAGAYKSGAFFNGQARLILIGKNETPRKRGP